MFGSGVLKGLGVTLKEFVGTYVDDIKKIPSRYAGGKEELDQTNASAQSGLFTVQYPEERRKLSERFRYIPMLVYDAETGEDRCTACGICAKVCPPQCIWIVRDKDEKGKPITRPAEFYIDTTDLHELRAVRRVLSLRRDQDEQRLRNRGFSTHAASCVRSERAARPDDVLRTHQAHRLGRGRGCASRQGGREGRETGETGEGGSCLWAGCSASLLLRPLPQLRQASALRKTLSASKLRQQLAAPQRSRRAEKPRHRWPPRLLAKQFLLRQRSLLRR